MQTKTAIYAHNLVKRYGDFTAVNGISFDIKVGECFGFLGPNGAGKTSTMRMLSCVSPVSEGELLVDGKDVRTERRSINHSLGIVSQADSLDPDLTVLQNLTAYCRYFNIPKAIAAERAWDALEFFQLNEKAHQTIDEISGGMRRRLMIARATLHNPKILVLDEPTTGLDPQARLLVWENLRLLEARGITILLTTHYMDEAAHLCDRLVVIDHGSILVEGAPRTLINEHVGEQVLELRLNPLNMTELAQQLTDDGIDFIHGGDSLYFYGDSRTQMHNYPAVNGHELVQRQGNLEDLFLRLTGRGLREE